ncbi:MAG TPA: NAD(P)/FAD-dependent oxidoreductase, partial [Campylobacteraceae bacterium]|nr:NAD(P)/FAD-dependent oxidoreductase [Campylobacteraceae bacterium]
MQAKEILIIGAGYGGLRAAEHLCKNGAFHITLVDKNPSHFMPTELYGYIAGEFDMSDIAIDLESFVRELGPNVTFV